MGFSEDQSGCGLAGLQGRNSLEGPEQSAGHEAERQGPGEVGERGRRGK